MNVRKMMNEIIKPKSIRESFIKKGFVRICDHSKSKLPRGTSLWVGKCGWRDYPKSASYLAVFLMEVENQNIIYGYLPYAFWSSPRRKVEKHLEKKARQIFDENYSEKLKEVPLFMEEEDLWEDLKREIEWGQSSAESPTI